MRTTMRIDGAGAMGSAPVVQLDRIEVEVLRDLVDLEATALVAEILDAATADELDAAILEARHRSRLLSGVEGGVLTLDARTVEIIEAERAATLDTLEHDRRRRAGTRQIDRLLDEITVYDRLLSRAAATRDRR
jgi:hypothetical protein